MSLLGQARDNRLLPQPKDGSSPAISALQRP
jgi:hypothetical protein